MTSRAEPFYMPTGDEVDIALRAYQARLPLLILGPTGCGKTRFVEYVASSVRATESGPGVVTASCHEDTSAWDLLGRFIIRDEQTIWVDGPVTKAVRGGLVCYLDELAEARRDTTVVVHSLTDYRRRLFVDRTGEELKAPDEFMLVASYNPALQTGRKRLKPSTFQRFVPIALDYPTPDVEAMIIAAEAGIGQDDAEVIVAVATKIRSAMDEQLSMAASTRSLVHVGMLLGQGIEARRALEVILATEIPEADPTATEAIRELIHAVAG